MRQEQQQQESGANERETSGDGAPRVEEQKWGESEKRGTADIEKLSVGLRGPWLDWGPQTRKRSIERPILPAACAPTPSTPPPGTAAISPRACRAPPRRSRGRGLPSAGRTVSRLVLPL